MRTIPTPSALSTVAQVVLLQRTHGRASRTASAAPGLRESREQPDKVVVGRRESSNAVPVVRDPAPPAVHLSLLHLEPAACCPRSMRHAPRRPHRGPPVVLVDPD